MSRKSWQFFNPMAPALFEAMADNVLLKDSTEHLEELRALGTAIETDPRWAAVWEESRVQHAIDRAYESRNLKLLKTALELRLSVARALAEGVDPETVRR